MSKSFTDMTKADMWAFWRYDQYPYYLGGKVTKLDVNGNVETLNYGPGHWFKPILLVPSEEGEKLSIKLKNLDCLYESALKKVRSEFKGHLAKVHPSIKDDITAQSNRSKS